ncbi:hypothetical protein [Clostridium tertium]|uniref:histidine kinase n=1 Tax=Clostridium tertium TaxID=1559 RepID=A0A6N3AIQ9_9CLOT
MFIHSYDIYILIKLVLSLYVAWTSIENNEINILVVLFILIYIIVIFIKGMVIKYDVLYKSLFIIEALLAIFFTTRYISSAILMICILIAEYFIKEKKRIYIGIILYIAPLILVINDSNIKNIIMILIIILVLVISYELNIKKIMDLDRIQEEQRKLIYNLQKKMSDERNLQEQILSTARLEERNKISSRLHDKIGHTISGTLLQLEASKYILNNDKEKGFSMLDTCIENLRNGMEEIRMTLRNIKPAEEELGINRIRKTLDEKIKDTDIKGKVSYSGDLDKISANIWIVFIQIIQELTTNSIKYSKGNLILVNIEVLNKIIKLEVKDNGKGCTNIKKGIGLRNIEESISKLNGKLVINSEEGFGIIILIPC